MMADMTPKALAAELNIDPKRLRGWLRKEFARASEAHNTTWAIDEATAEAARKRFAPKAEA